MDKVIQTIVMRAKFPDKESTRKLRTGKYCAQAAHASMAFLSSKFRNTQAVPVGYISTGGYNTKSIEVPEALTDEEATWIEDSFTKIVLYVNTEEELLKVYKDAQEAGLTVYLIKDSGLTEFDEPTYTALAIGPHYKSKIDEITKSLELF